MKTYREVFNHRGDRYHQAMTAYPLARDREFAALFTGIDVSSARNVIDIPAGGGYLKRYLGKTAALFECDPSDGFIGQSQSVMKIDDDSISLPSATYDLGICLAALHHIEPKDAFIQKVLLSLKPGGFLCIGDVLAGSKEARFLDEFAGTYNGTGHRGSYLTDSAAAWQTLIGDRGELIRHVYLACPWQFASKDELISFTKNLFGLSGLSDDELQTALQKRIGYFRQGDRYALDWHLLYVTIQRL